MQNKNENIGEKIFESMTFSIGDTIMNHKCICKEFDVKSCPHLPSDKIINPFFYDPSYLKISADLAKHVENDQNCNKKSCPSLKKSETSNNSSEKSKIPILSEKEITELFNECQVEDELEESENESDEVRIWRKLDNNETDPEVIESDIPEITNLESFNKIDQYPCFRMTLENLEKFRAEIDENSD